MQLDTFRKSLAAALMGLTLSVSGAISANFPSETIRLIVPYKPGGGTDSIARAFAASLEKVSGQAVVVENIPGSSGITGMLALTKAKPDGYTIGLFGTADVTAALAFRENPPFKAEDFSCAGAVFNTPVWLLSHKDNGYTDLSDFLAAAKADPGNRIFGITEKLSVTDFVVSTLKGTSGLDFKVVSFGGGGPLKKAILANQVHAGAILSPVLLDSVKAGDLSVLAAAGDLHGINHEPSRDTKHVREWGVDLDVSLVRGIWMPDGVPADVQAKMESHVTASIESDIFKDFGENFGFAPYGESGAGFCGRLSQEVIDLQGTLSEYIKR